MCFNTDRNKPAQEVIFSRKNIKGLNLDVKLSLTNCISDKTDYTLKGLVLLRKINTLLPCQSMLTIYKSFIRPHLD